MQLVVLAGGIGSRIRKVTTGPKILLSIGDRSLLELQIAHWNSWGITDYLFLLGYKSDVVIAELELIKRGNPNLQITWIIEPIQLGTGGALINALKENQLTSKFVLVNADTWIDLSFDLREWYDSPCGKAFMAVAHCSGADSYGLVAVENDVVIGFTEKKQISSSGVVNAGLIGFFRDDLEDFPQAFKKQSLEFDILPFLVRRREYRALYVHRFADLGTPERYYRYLKEFLGLSDIE